jgi:hypothetical protein
MENIATTAAEIELYKDMVKIGVPALFGFLAGLTPFMLEKTKMKETRRKENLEFRNTQVIELIDCFSKFSGNLSVFMSFVLSKEHNRGEIFDAKLSAASDEMLANEVGLKKAKALAGLLGNAELIKIFEEFDKLVSIALNALQDPIRENWSNKDPAISNLKNKENEVIKALSSLM